MAVEKPQAKCQCLDLDKQPCIHLAIVNSLFCQHHQKCVPSPESGSEPKYEPEKFNKDPTLYKAFNCYSYAMNVVDRKLAEECKKNKGKDCRKLFQQPGALHGERDALNTEARRRCEVVIDLIKKDVPEVIETTFDAICPDGMSKIALVVDRGEDYHFYRRDQDDEGMKKYLETLGFKDRGVGLWSHKDGSNKIKRFDALGRPIFNPQTASRDYTVQGSDLNYEDFCGFFCVPRNHKIRLGQGGSRKATGGTRSARQAGLSWKDHRSQRQSRRRHRKA